MMRIAGLGAAWAFLVELTAATHVGGNAVRSLPTARAGETPPADVRGAVPCELVAKPDVDTAFAPIRFRDVSTAPAFCHFEDADRVVSVSVYTLPAFVSVVGPDSMKVLARKQSGRGTPAVDVPDLGAAAFWYDDTRGSDPAFGLYVMKAGGVWMQLKVRQMKEKDAAVAGLIALAKVSLAKA